MKQLSEIKRITLDCWESTKSFNVWAYMGLQDVRNQFRRSRLGFAWLLINLTITAIAIGYIYGRLFHQDLSHFLPRLLINLTTWSFITATIVQGCQAFIISEGYVKQFSFPKQIYIFRFFVTSVINFSIGFFVFLLIALINHIQMDWRALFFIPGFLLLLWVGLAHLVISAYWGSLFRDLSPALGGIFQVLFYVTPIVFTPTMLADKGMAFIYQYNPFYYLMEVVSFPLLYSQAASAEMYFFALVYGSSLWLLALLTMLKMDRKVAYWL